MFQETPWPDSETVLSMPIGLSGRVVYASVQEWSQEHGMSYLSEA
jgi:hypothetical protein